MIWMAMGLLELAISSFLSRTLAKRLNPTSANLNVAMPPFAVREAFGLSPFYQQWIDVEGLPVVASSKVNPYALQEAAWLIRQMIGHRPDLLQAMAQNKVRFSVMAYNEMTTQIPEHNCGCFFEWPSHKIYRRYIALYAQFPYIDLVE